MKNFNKILKERLEAIDKRVMKKSIKTVSGITYWEIRKRSLNPIGIDKIVLGGLKMPEAVRFWKKLFKTKTLDNGQIIYYDLVMEEDINKSIYANPSQIIKENKNG